MVGELGAVSLVDEYRRLRRHVLEITAKDGDLQGYERELDAIYKLIVSKPIGDIHTALEKLWFAHHCLTEEDDFKEASNLVYQVCLALESLSQASEQSVSVA